ncbi:MAG TPA: hypothetical protein VHZ03_08300 [Trebonia sp.]|jgi:hypothetical protein|nr:hypothetical protein [Trebonia sp.]
MANYTAELTADQIFNFADLVRRLNYIGEADYDNPLRQDIADALQAFMNLLPEPTDSDGDAYLAKMRAGEFVDWNADDKPITAPLAEVMR